MLWHTMSGIHLASNFSVALTVCVGGWVGASLSSLIMHGVNFDNELKV